ncbi:MAG: hypothetical protein IJU98_01825 [Synergistaceae bacterium]|nr:hypothetical protein [Synergistaceae bacterium]
MDAKKKGAPKLPADKKKIVVIGCIVVILLLNIMWTVLQNKFAPRVDEVRADLTKLEQRITKLEQGGLPDVADLREEFSSLKNISKGYEERLAQLVAAEEEQLATLQAQVERQKARVESLKQQVAPEEAKPEEAK